jgi:hypothetical protein
MMLCSFALLLAGSFTRDAESAPVPNPPTATMQIEWEWRVELDFPICGLGGTMSGDPRPTQRFLATSIAGTLLSEWGPANASTVSDINRDDRVDGADLGYLLSNWGPSTN